MPCSRTIISVGQGTEFMCYVWALLMHTHTHTSMCVYGIWSIHFKLRPLQTNIMIYSFKRFILPYFAFDAVHAVSFCA